MNLPSYIRLLLDDVRHMPGRVYRSPCTVFLDLLAARIPGARVQKRAKHPKILLQSIPENLNDILNDLVGPENVHRAGFPDPYLRRGERWKVQVDKNTLLWVSLWVDKQITAMDISP